MVSKELDDILTLARKESAQSGHFYIGVEHLFIALTKLKGGVTSSTLEEHGITPRFVRYLIRQELGQGDNRRFWPGFRETPRLHTVLRLAQELAQAHGEEFPSERDLFLAILQEGDSLPYRTLRDMGADIDQLMAMAANWSADMRPQQPLVPIRVREGVGLSAMEIGVLQQMFRGYEHVVIERRLEGGYSDATVLVASPYRADGRPDASVVVKLDERQAILYEKMRYDSFVRDTLPPATARVLDNPIVPDRSPLGGLKYTFLRNPSETGPVDLAAYARERGPEALGHFLWDGLYRVFRETWWSQRHAYRFAGWQEYEMVLPPALVVEVGEGLPTPRQKLLPMGQWSRRGRFAYQEVVSLEGFTVHYVYPTRQAVQLVAGAGPEAFNRASKVEVRGIDLSSGRFYRGAVIDRLVGRVLYTRDDLLHQQVAALEPDFDPTGERMPEHPAFPALLPNPLRRYLNLLQRPISGSLSIIHGDLHLRNILVGPGDNAWLIDFAWTREGHTLFDWAVLETSLLIEVVAPAIEGEGWEAVWPVVRLLAEMGGAEDAPPGRMPVERALQPIATVRQIVAECLADPEDWGEYFVALGLCALRGLGWAAAPPMARRLLFLVAALAMASAAVKDASSPTSPDIDKTDVNLHF